MAKVYPIIENASHLDHHFYSHFDPSFLFNKARTLLMAANCEDDFSSRFSDIMIPNENIDSKYFEAIRAEIFFSGIHAIECFFALFLAPFQNDSHWVFLSKYLQQEIDSFAELLLSDKVASLSSGKYKSISQLIDVSIFSSYKVANEADIFSEITWAMKQMATLFLKWRVPYNSYKHGLRLFTGDSKIVVAADKSKPSFEMESRDSATYLELGTLQTGKPVWKMKTKTFNLVSIYNLHILISYMQKNIRVGRISRIEGQKNVLFSTFKIDKYAFSKLRESFEFSFDISA